MKNPNSKLKPANEEKTELHIIRKRDGGMERRGREGRRDGKEGGKESDKEDMRGWEGKDFLTLQFSDA